MGLLDDLEGEAQKRRADEDDSAARKAAREAAYRTTLEPALESFHGYLGELVAKLKELQPRIAMRYAVPGYGDVVGYVEHEYELRMERQASARSVFLTMPCAIASQECPAVQVEGATRVRALAALFQRHRLGAMLAPAKDASGEVVSGTFKARGRITLAARFHADASTGQFRLDFNNFDDLSMATKLVPPDQVNEALYDEIGRYLMREPTELMREALPDDYRAQLRERVQRQEIRRRWEAQIGDRQQAEVAMLKREYGITARFARLGGAMDKLRGLVGRKNP
ncbi:hypothetical protein ACQQ2N_10140 [Dokdonella sp. MW10]|uniref:hypothetical protein n=1 Tax=Dokdonella sp. MW10 TaxID=2992926 RepID=UPI003F7DF2EB